MKRMIFGALLTLVGLLFSVSCFIYDRWNPVVAKGADTPFTLSFAVMCAGLAICGWEAFRKDR